jgi:prepilin-type N-terminal cleavage/methylation domain-containing protein
MRSQIKSSFLPADRRPPAGHSGGPAANMRPRPNNRGFTLMEVVISMVIVALTFGAIIQGYLSSAIKGQWTGYSLAAQSLGLQTIEQCRSAVWDGGSGNNELTNLAVINPSYNPISQTFTGYTTNILDVPWKGTNYVLATNYVSIKMYYLDNNSAWQVQLQMVRVDTVWPFAGWGNGSVKYYTNTVCTLVAPDNRDPETLGANPPAQD